MLSLLLTAQIFFGVWSSTPLDPSEELGWGDHRTKLYFHYPPDPVNVRTLNFFFPSVHLTLPCFVSIEIKAAYNSYADPKDETIFGRKWTFNHNILVREAITHFEVVEGDGYVNSYTRERNLEEATKTLVSNIMVNLKKEDALKKTLKSDTEYADIENRLKNDKIYRQQMARNMVKSARPLGPGEYYSLARGQSTLIKKPDGSFERRFQNGTKEFFNSRGRLTRSEDRNGNHLAYQYQENNLTKISDMCGRSVEFAYHSVPASRGLVRSITDSLGRSITYSFDGSRYLLSYSSSDKKNVEFRYDKRGNLIELKDNSDASSNFRISYNDKLEVQSQDGPEKNKTDYKRSFVANDPNHTITEITKFNDGAMTGREIHEFKSGEYEVVTKYDKSGKETSKTTKKISKQTGYPVSILNARGEGDLFEYEPSNGNLISRENVPGREKITFGYEPQCNQVNNVRISKPNGPIKETAYRFDNKCNVVEATETQGGKKTGWVNVIHTPQGKPKFLIDKINNQQIAFTYWQYGKPESITLRDVGTLLVKYKFTGEIDEVKTRPHGKGEQTYKGQDPSVYQGSILREVRSVLDGMLGLLRPAGLNIGL